MWKEIDGFEGLYEVSDDGCVRSTTRWILDSTGKSYLKHGKELKPTLVGKGYKTVSLMKNGIRTVQYIHRLVAQAFVPGYHPHYVVNHKDGNKLNCCASNLEWVTYSANNQHAYDTGLKKRGSLFYSSKLSENDVAEIRGVFKNQTYQEIASKYGVSRATIRDIILRRTWKTVAIDQKKSSTTIQLRRNSAIGVGRRRKSGVGESPLNRSASYLRRADNDIV